MGDDAFGVELVRRLAGERTSMALPAGADASIRYVIDTRFRRWPAGKYRKSSGEKDSPLGGRHHSSRLEAEIVCSKLPSAPSSARRFPTTALNLKSTPNF
jgi:hypothetical protein